MTENELGRICQRCDSFVRRRRLILRIAVIDENGMASRRLAGMHVLPAVAHEVARAQIDAMLGGGFKKQARFGLAA